MFKRRTKQEKARNTAEKARRKAERETISYSEIIPGKILSDVKWTAKYGGFSTTHRVDKNVDRLLPDFYSDVIKFLQSEGLTVTERSNEYNENKYLDISWV